jgi:hypothetical protein
MQARCKLDASSMQARCKLDASSMQARCKGERVNRPIRWANSAKVATFALPMLAVALLALAGCGASSAPPPQFSGGIYESPPQYHFKVSFPNGWKANVIADPTATATNPVFPLTVTITRSSTSQATSSIVSNLTVALLDLRDPQLVDKNLLKAATTRSANPAYHAVKIAGLTAYATPPVQQPLPNGGQTITHVDYFLLVNNIEYHLSTDAVSGDKADDDLASMLASFTLT